MMLDTVAEELDSSTDGMNTRTFVLVGNADEDENVKKAILAMNYRYCHSRTGREHLVHTKCHCSEFGIDPDGEHTMVHQGSVFVLDDFCGPLFNTLQTNKLPVIGPTVILQMYEKELDLPRELRWPTYTLSMKGCVLVATGFDERDDLRQYVELLHYMGAAVRKDISTSVTHLLCRATGGRKYRWGVVKNKPTMSPEWVEHCWQNRRLADFKPTSEQLISQFRTPTFMGCVLQFVNFEPNELQRIHTITRDNGGLVDGDPAAHLTTHVTTHVVFNETTNSSPPAHILDKLQNRHVVTGQWFYESLMVGYAADETMFPFKIPGQQYSPVSSSHHSPRDLKRATPIRSGNVRSRRHRQRKSVELLAQSQIDDSPNSYADKYSVSSSGLMSPPANTHDGPFSPLASIGEKKRSPLGERGNLSTDEKLNGRPVVKQRRSGAFAQAALASTTSTSKRFMVASELLQTETNYVSVLETVDSIRRDLELRGASAAAGKQMLSAQDMRTIFDALPPIVALHTSLQQDLKTLIDNWTDDGETSVGNVLLKYETSFVSVYPRFVNFFETIKETLERCERTNDELFTFLERHRRRPECERQKLVDLLMRPVQRLPSIQLLLGDLLKKTPDSFPDKQHLEKALQMIKESLRKINDSKRVMESHQTMFSLIGEIDAIDPTLVSANRTFITRIHLVDLGSMTSYVDSSERGSAVTIFVFTDMLVFCKRRCDKNIALALSSTSSMRSLSPGGESTSGLTTLGWGQGPSGTATISRGGSGGGGVHHHGKKKCFKFLKSFSLRNVFRLIDFSSSPEFANCFAIVAIFPDNKGLMQHYMMAYTLLGAEPLSQILDLLAQQVAIVNGEAAYKSYITVGNAPDLDLEPAPQSSLRIGNLFSKNSKRRKPLQRNGSMREPKRSLKKSVSQFFSPLTTGLRRRSGIMKPGRLNAFDLRRGSTGDGASSPTPSVGSNFDMSYIGEESDDLASRLSPNLMPPPPLPPPDTDRQARINRIPSDASSTSYISIKSYF